MDFSTTTRLLASGSAVADPVTQDYSTVETQVSSYVLGVFCTASCMYYAIEWVKKINRRDTQGPQRAINTLIVAHLTFACSVKLESAHLKWTW